ncbi:MAG TPA: hypothetical protein PKY55_14085 [bacterium]|nr:hypothetical protein [bacterium]HPG84409.1 hypothetical protein [bacterium]HPM59620.1 hypothetical protein [bacterium]
MKRFGAIAGLLLMLALGASASEGDGGYAGAFLRMGIGARAKAMGDAFSAVAEDAFAGVYNPALLPHLPGRLAALSYAFLPLDRKLDFIGYAQPLRPGNGEDGEHNPLRAGFGLAWIHAGVDGIDGRDLAGNHTQDYSFSENAFFLSFALSPAEKFSIGVNGKILYARMPGVNNDESAVTSMGLGVDFGAYYAPFRQLSLGLVMRDNLSKYTWNTEKVWERGTSVNDRFPRTLRLAVAYRPPVEWLLLTAESEDAKEQNPRYHFGAEAALPAVGALRAGLDDGQLTFGLGCNLQIYGKKMALNYAYVAPGEGPRADHIFSWHASL